VLFPILSVIVCVCDSVYRGEESTKSRELTEEELTKVQHT